MNDRLYRLSSIGRPVDPAYPTNRAIAGLSLGVLVAVLLVSMLAGAEPPEALVRGLVWAAGFFLAWALAREVDPDRPASAFVAAGLSLPALWVFGRPGFAALFLALLALRIVNRTVGPPAKAIDTVLMLGVAALVGWQGHPVVAGMAAAAFLLDGLLRTPLRIHLAAAGAALAAAGLGASMLGPTVPPDGGTWIALVAALPFVQVIRRSATPTAVSDVDALPLHGVRVRAAQVLALVTVFGAALVEGPAGLAAISSLWAAVAGTGVYALFTSRSAPPPGSPTPSTSRRSS